MALVIDSLQPRYQITGAATQANSKRPDLDLMQTVRDALMDAYDQLPDIFDTMKPSPDQV
ncbi:MAG: hypothetical protein HRU31_02235 [Rhodobacteraceae bacterium]|nr:hypothetical protein [Paracoccaceae bacterium]